MLVGRGGRDAGAAAGVGQREAVGPMLDQKLARGRNQRFAKIPWWNRFFARTAVRSFAWAMNFLPEAVV